MSDFRTDTTPLGTVQTVDGVAFTHIAFDGAFHSHPNHAGRTLWRAEPNGIAYDVQPSEPWASGPYRLYGKPGRTYANLEAACRAALDTKRAEYLQALQTVAAYQDAMCNAPAFKAEWSKLIGGKS